MVSSSRRKARRDHFQAPSSERRVLMSAPLAKELRGQHKIRSIPLRKDDEVKVISGRHKGSEGKVTQVYRKKWVVHVERIHREKTNGATVPIALRPNNLSITKLKLDSDRKAIIARKSAGKGGDDMNVD